MKRIFLLLGMMAMLCTLWACAGETPGEGAGETLFADDEAIKYAEGMVQEFDAIFTQGSFNDAVEYYAQNYPMLADALKSYVSLLDEIGKYQGVTGSMVTGRTADTVTVEVEIEGSLRNASAEIVFNETGYKSITMSAQYTMGEKMQKAAMNTLIGMGTVFVILILISVIISMFTLIPGSGKMPEKKPASAVDDALNRATAQIKEREETETERTAAQDKEQGQTSDEELIAVISAAIAAYEAGVVAAPGVVVHSRPGTGDLDTFVVRSIRRKGRA